MIFFRWYAKEESTQQEYGDGPGLLLWDDVEKELARLGPATKAEPPPP